MIVGESLWGVIYAGLIGLNVPLEVVPESFSGAATWLGLALFIGIIVTLYRRTQKVAADDMTPE